MEGVIILAIIGGLYFISQRNTRPIIIMSPQQNTSNPVVVRGGGDDRYSIAPRPQRLWDAPLEVPTRGALDSIATRGPPEEYQQMGIINSGDGKLLPLYGRRVAARSDYFNYYTRTDTYNPVAIPVSFKKRDCQDNIGCQEVMSGDEIIMKPTGESAKVTLYGFDGPRYQ